MINLFPFYESLNNQVQKFIRNLGPGALAAKYYAGEQRLDTAGKIAYISLAGDCTGSSMKEMIAGDLLQKILGNASKS